MNFSIPVNQKNADVKINLRSRDGGVELYDIDVSYPEPTQSGLIDVRFFFPIIDIYSVYFPGEMYALHLRSNWCAKQCASSLNGGAPVLAFISSTGRNRLTVSHDDPVNPMIIAEGVNEFDKSVQIDLKIFAFDPALVKDYHITLRLDYSDIRYDEAITDVVKFWEDCGYKPDYIPDLARRPLYSCWYTFHQDVDPDRIVRECELAKSYGMDVMIVDDGWQCDDSNGGYRYCGDWEVAESKVPDMADFGRRVHGTGMKFMLWYNFAGVGVCSKAHERFKDMLLNPFDKDCAELDPRFPEVRKYLVDTYRKAIVEWDVDGFKLDFVDAVYHRQGTKDPNDDMDYASIEEALYALLGEISDMARSYKPDFMIEFRQMFFGPAMRKVATMFRVGDCANDPLPNRVNGIGMRRILASSPVHSDMLMWNRDDTAEGVMGQLLSCMFVVPQISVSLADISKEHSKLLRNYLSFWNAHRETILDGKLEADNPEAANSLVRAIKDGETVAVAYTKPVIEIKTEKAFVFNMTDSDTLYIKTDGKKFTYTVRDCFGEYVTDGMSDCTLTDIAVPHCGMVEITF